MSVLIAAGFEGSALAVPTRTIPMTGKVLNIPIAADTSTGTSGTLRVMVSGTVIHVISGTFPNDSNASNIRMWTYLEMDEYLGATATVELTTNGPANPTPFMDLIETSNSLRAVKPLFTETGRPQFHFSQKVGWNNDTNGMV